jgi:hypothetical protein
MDIDNAANNLIFLSHTQWREEMPAFSFPHSKAGSTSA